MDLLTKERAKKLKKMRKTGRAAEIDEEEPDLVEVGQITAITAGWEREKQKAPRTASHGYTNITNLNL